VCARPANPELRSEILKAATRIVEQCGPDCVTMREVASEVGYTPTTLYLYFKDKHAILREIIVSGFDDMADAMDASAVGPTPLDKLRQRARAYVVWGVMHPGLYQLMLESRIDADFTPEQTARIVRGPAASGAVIDEAMTAGTLRGVDDPVTFGSAMWVATHGATSLAISRRLGNFASPLSAAETLETANRVADTLVNALLAPHLT